MAVSTLSMLRGKNGAGNDISKAEQGRDIADDLTHRPIRRCHAALVDALDRKEPDVRREDDSRLATRKSVAHH